MLAFFALLTQHLFFCHFSIEGCWVDVNGNFAISCSLLPFNMTVLTLSRHHATILVGNIVCNKSITGVKCKEPVAITNLLFSKERVMSVSRTHATCTLCHSALRPWHVHTCSLCGKTMCSRHVHLVKMPHSRVLCTYCMECYGHLPPSTSTHSTAEIHIHWKLFYAAITCWRCPGQLSPWPG